MFGEDQTMTPAALENVIRLNCNDQGKVVVTAQDQDRFVMTIEQAAAACAEGDKAIRFGKQLENVLLPKLGAWLAGHQAAVRKAFLTQREGRLLFLVIQSTAPYDRQLADDLTALDLDVARDASLDLIPLSVMALPAVDDNAAASFMESGPAMVFANAK